MSEQQPQYVYVQQPSAMPQKNGFALASMIFGILAIVVGIIPLFIGLILSFAPAILAVVFGIVGLGRHGRVGRGFGMALTGMILGGLTVLLWFTGYGIIW